MTYNFNQTLEKVQETLGYPLSYKKLQDYKKQGVLKSCGRKFIPEINKEVEIYDDEGISQFIEEYKKLVESRVALQWRHKKFGS